MQQEMRLEKRALASRQMDAIVCSSKSPASSPHLRDSVALLSTIEVSPVYQAGEKEGVFIFCRPGLKGCCRAGGGWGLPAAPVGFGEGVAGEGPAPLPLLLAVEEAKGISRNGKLCPR